MKVDFWKTKSLYELNTWQTEGLAKALKDLGVEVRYIDEESHYIRSSLQRLWSEPPRKILSFAAIPFIKNLKLDIPHLQLQSLLPAIPKEVITPPIAKKGIAYFGSYRDNESINKNLYQFFSTRIIEKIRVSLKECLEGIPPQEAFQEEADKMLGVDREAVYFLMDYLVRSLLAKKMLQSFDSVAIYGSMLLPEDYRSLCKGSWEKWACTYPHFSYHGPLSAPEVVSAMSGYALILDPTPGYSAVSLRLLQGLASGGEVLTYRNPLVESYFGRGNGVSYVGEDPLPQNIEEGQAILRKFFIWEVRAKEILDGID